MAASTIKDILESRRQLADRMKNDLAAARGERRVDPELPIKERKRAIENLRRGLTQAQTEWGQISIALARLPT